MGRRIVRRVQKSHSKQNRVQKKSNAPGTTANPLVDLQRSIGSQAVQRLINSPYIQTKLEVSSPDDQSEREADQTAGEVMRSAEGAGSANTGTSAHGSNQSEDRQLDTGVSSGQLPESVRTFMEPRLGADLSGVRVHTGHEAAELSVYFQAQAFTHGRDVYFAEGKSPANDALTAHELTHVVQQTGDGKEPSGSVHPKLISRTPDDDKKKPETYWFQNKPPEAPIEDKKTGIPITPKGQVFLDPNVRGIASEQLGTFKVQFAGLDTDFSNSKPDATFAAAENTIIEAIRGAIGDLGALPDIKGAESMKAALAQRREDETVRARLKEAARGLDGKVLNIFIATNLSSAELMSPGTPSPSTSQIFVRPGDIGDRSKLQAAIRIPLVGLTGGSRIAIGSDKKPEETGSKELTAEQVKEALLHEMVHVMLIDKGLAAVQVWPKAMTDAVSGPADIKEVAEDVLFRYVRAQEEIFVYKAIAGVYSAFKGNKDRYDAYVSLVEAFVRSVGGKLEPQKSAAIEVKEQIGEGKKKEKVSWSIAYTLAKGVKVDKDQLKTLKEIQKFDIGS